MTVAGHALPQFTLIIEEGDHVDAQVVIRTRHLERARCAVSHTVLADGPGQVVETERLDPKASQVLALVDGLHTFMVTCPSWQGVLTKTVAVRAADQSPELCRGFTFTETPIVVGTLDELKAGIIGTWTGCVANPYGPTYQVTITFRQDGTYSASSDDVIDGAEMRALYWFPDRDSADKRYELDGWSTDLEGSGRIDLVKADGGILAGDLRAIRLMDGQLMFAFYHGTAGPLTFRLHRP